MLDILRIFFEGRSNAVSELSQIVNSSVILDFIKCMKWMGDWSLEIPFS